MNRRQFICTAVAAAVTPVLGDGVALVSRAHPANTNCDQCGAKVALIECTLWGDFQLCASCDEEAMDKFETYLRAADAIEAAERKLAVDFLE